MKKYLKLYKRNFKGRSVRRRTITRATAVARCTCARSRRWAIREHCKEPVGEVSTLWTYNPRRCALLRIVSNTANCRCACVISAPSFWLEFCCILFWMWRDWSVWNCCRMARRSVSHASLNSFFYPVLKHGSRSLRLKRALWWVKPESTRKEIKVFGLANRSRVACGVRAYSESLNELFLFSVASKFLILRPEKKRSIHDLNEVKGNFDGSLNTLWRANPC